MAGKRLCSLDHEGLFIPENGVEGTVEEPAAPRMREYTRIIPHSVVLESENAERFLLVPSYKIHRPLFVSHPMSTAIDFLRDPPVESMGGTTWNARLRSTHFVYPVHPSTVYLSTESLSSALYLMAVYLFRREYVYAARLMDSVFTDVKVGAAIYHRSH